VKHGWHVTPLMHAIENNIYCLPFINRSRSWSHIQFAENEKQ
jgi:hypothetical protein